MLRAGRARSMQGSMHAILLLQKAMINLRQGHLEWQRTCNRRRSLICWRPSHPVHLLTECAT